MPRPQAGIFIEGSVHHHHLEYALRDGADAAGVSAAVAGALAAVANVASADGPYAIVGFGDAAWRMLAPDRVPRSLHPFAPIGEAGGRHAPATQRDLWLWFHADRRDRNFDGALAAHRALSPVASLELELTGFDYHESRDLIGFVDGTANPKDEAGKHAAALIGEGAPGAGGAYAMSQTWVHDLASFHGLPVAEQERVIGRTKTDDVEMEGDAMPADSHVSRTDAELDGVALKIYRRSTPFGGVARHGLHFVAFACDPIRFEVQLQRMFGTAGDGLHDRLIEFSRAETGSYWFVPSQDDLDALFG